MVFAISRNIFSVDYDFNWLGRVPCRSVRISGMVVGIKDYESKRIYTSAVPPFFCSVQLNSRAQFPPVDDNTGIVECYHKDLVTPFSPSKRRGNTFNGFSYPPLPTPVTYVGRPVTLVGRVCRGRKVYLIIESISEHHPGGCYFFLITIKLTVTITSTMQIP